MEEDRKEVVVFATIITILATLVVILALSMTQPATRDSKAVKYDLNCTGTLEQCKMKN